MRNIGSIGLLLVAAVATAAPLSGTNYLVTVGVDDDTANGNCTLREALTAATNDVARDLCPAGSSATSDVIQLLGSYTWTLGPFTVFAGEVVVRGATAPFTAFLDLGDHSRFLAVISGASVALENLNISDGNAFADPGTPRGGVVLAFEAALTLRNTNVSSSRAYEGGAVYFASSGPSLLIDRCQLVSNAAENAGGNPLPSGGALFVTIGGTASARIVDTRIADNQVRSTVNGGAVRGGGLFANVGGGSVLEVLQVDFDGNVAAPGSGGFSDGAGAVLAAFNAARATVADTLWTDNDLQGNSAFGSGLSFVSNGTASGRLERARFVGNDVGEPRSQLLLQTLGQSSLVANSILVADGSDVGMRGEASQASTLRVGHATIVGADQGASLLVLDSAVVRVENSLFWDNVTDVVDTVPSSVDPSTMTGVNPLFVSPGGGDYRLGSGSPAIDFGNRLLPSVGPYDLAHAPRVIGAQTDAGAFERGGVFADGFESGDAGPWSAASP